MLVRKVYFSVVEMHFPVSKARFMVEKLHLSTGASARGRWRRRPLRWARATVLDGAGRAGDTAVIRFGKWGMGMGNVKAKAWTFLSTR